jgi:hypothetical protein
MTSLDILDMYFTILDIFRQYVVKIAINKVTMGGFRNRGDLDNAKTLYVRVAAALLFDQERLYFTHIHNISVLEPWFSL